MSKRISRNPFFNFIQSYRTRHVNWPATKIAVEGAKLWHAMCPADRVRFVKESQMTKKKPQRTGSILKKNKGGQGKSCCYSSGGRGRRGGRSKSRGRRSRSRRSRSRRKH